MSSHRRGRATGLRDQRGEVLDLALRGVRRSVTARAPTAPVVAIDGERFGQEWRQPVERAEPPEVAGRLHQEKWRSRAGSIECDLCAISGHDG